MDKCVFGEGVKQGSWREREKVRKEGERISLI
jgi:hypothetical protein